MTDGIRPTRIVAQGGFVPRHQSEASGPNFVCRTSRQRIRIAQDSTEIQVVLGNYRVEDSPDHSVEKPSVTPFVAQVDVEWPGLKTVRCTWSGQEKTTVPP